MMSEAQRMAALGEEELLGELLPKESARHLLREYASLYNVFLHTSDLQLKTVPGIGEAHFKRLLCVREVINRVKQERRKTIRAVRSPADVMQFFRYLEDKEQEELWVLLLNTKNHILQAKQISLGSLNASIALPREIFHAAVQGMAAALILVHNHPSGDAAPSREDLMMTKRIIRAGQILDIPVLDHVIIGKHGSQSIKEQNAFLWAEKRQAA